MITTNAQQIHATKIQVVFTNLLNVQINVHVPMILANLQLVVIMKESPVTITMNALMIPAIPTLDVNMYPKIVKTMMLAPQIHAHLEDAHTYRLIVMIMMHVPQIHVRMVPASMRTLIVLMMMFAQKTPVIE